MSAQSQKEEINLLPEKGFESTTTGRVLAWILSTFRVIVIITEVIVTIAFLSRFWLDASNSDLTEKIEQKQAVLAASQTFEKQFKSAQLRLSVFTSLTKNQSVTPEIMKTIVQALPPDVVLTDISFSEAGIKVMGNTPSERSVQQLAVNLNSSDVFDRFEVTGIGTSLENSTFLDFTIESKTKPTN